MSVAVLAILCILVLTPTKIIIRTSFFCAGYSSNLILYTCYFYVEKRQLMIMSQSNSNLMHLSHGQTKGKEKHSLPKLRCKTNKRSINRATRLLCIHDQNDR